MTLKEIYDSNKDVRESQIPESWRNSFNEFMFGSTCMVDYREDGSIKDFIYYAQDFRQWYNQNRKEIERELKIDKVIKG